VHRPLAVYASEEAHAVIARAADILGLGRRAVRAVPVDEELRMRPDALAAMLEDDDAQHMAVVATAGTTTTGAIDPLPALADLAAAHGAWFHVDAAYGGAAVLADDLRPALAGIERADSLAIDPHKWLYVSTPCGCVLLRDHGRLGPSFAADGSYIWMAEQARQGLDIAQTGPDFSRGFLALKVTGVAARPRACRLRAPHLPRRRAGALPRGAGRGAPGLRAAVPAVPVDLLLPPRPRRRRRP